MTDPTTGMSKGFGFVQYADPAAAATALGVMNGWDLEGRALIVKPADRNAGEKTSRAPPAAQVVLPTLAPAPAASDNLYVSGVPQQWTEAELNVFFGTYGTVVSSLVLKDKSTGKSRGSAMVRYADSATAALAIQTLNGHRVEGGVKALEVKFADRAEERKPKRTGPPERSLEAGYQQVQRFDPYGPRASFRVLPAAPAPALAYSHLSPPGALPVQAAGFAPAPAPSVTIPRRYECVPEDGANLHITGLEKNLTDLHLYQAFSGFGAINSVRVILDHSGQPKGFGFVQFMRTADAQTAMASVDGLPVGSKAWVVTPHKKREAKA